jgi:hypothetical protein
MGLWASLCLHLAGFEVDVHLLFGPCSTSVVTAYTSASMHVSVLKAVCKSLEGIQQTDSTSSRCHSVQLPLGESQPCLGFHCQYLTTLACCKMRHTGRASLPICQAWHCQSHQLGILTHITRHHKKFRVHAVLIIQYILRLTWCDIG